MKVGVLKEINPGETRVALIPDDIRKLAKAGMEFLVESGAGTASQHPDGEYEKVGAKIVTDRSEIFQNAEIVVKVNRPLGAEAEDAGSEDEISRLKEGQILISHLQSLYKPATARALAAAKITAFSMELVPRITRAQAMDALSSQSTIAGYEAVMLAATELPRMMPMMMTAAGTLSPAKVLVLGAGVAGLQAIATSRRMGATVEAFDPRPAAGEQVLSLGAKFIEVPLTEEEKKESAETKGGYARQMTEDYYRRQRELIHSKARQVDVIITTAQIFGKKAPILVTKEMVADMKPGSVVVDLAVETGGNTEGIEYNKITDVNGVKLIGLANLPARIPTHASQMYSRNIYEFLNNMWMEGKLDMNPEDEIVAGSLLTQNGEIRHELSKKVAEEGAGGK